MSNASLFSPHWYRVSDVAPWLASDVTVHRHEYRGKSSYLLHRKSTGSHYRVDIAAFELIDRLDGMITVDALWHQVMAERADAAPSQSELLQLFGELHDAELLVVNKRLDVEQLFSRSTEAQRQDTAQRYLNPLFMRFALHDPEPWLRHIQPFCKVLFGRAAAILWLLLLASCVFLLLPEWSRLQQEISAFDPFSARNITALVLVYPCLKLLHELAHAFAVKRCGAEVRELGIALMVLLPLPYVDASASAVFSRKRDRMLVDAAGMLLELGVAAIAGIVWVTTIGPVHELALIVLLIAGLSTVLFNGNPLLKFDGYYLLADWLEIPNLQNRAGRYLALIGRRYLLAQAVELPDVDRREALWLILYGIASRLYRVVLMLSIAWMLSDQFFLFGVLLSIYVVITALCLPVGKLVSSVAGESSVSLRRRLLILAGMPLLLMTPVFALPLPLATTTSGVVWLPDEAVVRAASDCEVVDVQQAIGQLVEKGNTLFVCEAPALQTRRKILQARIDELSAAAAGMSRHDPLEHSRLQREKKALALRLRYVNERLDGLRFVAQLDGRFDVSGDSALLGRFLNAGDIAAYIVPVSARSVRVAIDEADSSWLDEVSEVRVRVQQADGHASVYQTTVQRRSPTASYDLPSPALSTEGGGDLLLNPDGNGSSLLSPAFDIELAWPESLSATPIGTHVGVRFVHPSMPLAKRLQVKLQRSVLGRFDS